MKQYITGKLNTNEPIFAINVWDVQCLAKDRIGRELNYHEINTKKNNRMGIY